MPWKLKKNKKGWSVRSPSGIRAKHTTKRLARRQIRLLRWLEYNKTHNLPPPHLIG